MCNYKLWHFILTRVNYNRVLTRHLLSINLHIGNALLTMNCLIGYLLKNHQYLSKINLTEC